MFADANWRKPRDKDKRTHKGNTTLTDKQKDEYRAANKCFNCGEVGHLSKDCPKKNRAKPSGVRANATTVKPEEKIRASSAFLKELEELTKTKERIEVSALTVNAGRMSGSKKKDENEVKHIERNATRVKDVARRVPKTMVIQAEVV
ncbi:hypothetical protein FRC12_004361 [Ceratobasidium sp. 428]|nr:hypothetical protein FRC12_004361 [Ceratobasidium sp. 428]